MILRNNSGTVIDEVAWGSGGKSISGWGSTSKPSASEGKTIRRANPDTDTNTYSDWINNSYPDPDCGDSTNTKAKIVLSESELFFNTVLGDSIVSQTFNISNGGSGTLHWSISTDAGWLKCSPVSGTDASKILVSIEDSGLSSGNYSGIIKVIDPDAINSPQVIAVKLTLTECLPSRIKLSTTRLNFTSENDSEIQPQSFNISNLGCKTLSWALKSNKSWLKCSPVKGEDSAEISVNADSSGLANGTYTGTITVTGVDASNSPQTVSVTLKIDHCLPAAIKLSHTKLNFYSVKGVSTSIQNFEISNTGCKTMVWTAISNREWLICKPNSGTDSGKINVSVDTSGLNPGDFNGTVIVRSNDAINSPKTINVTLKLYSTDSVPFGSFETPLDNSTVSGSIPVTGWALDDVGVQSVKIFGKDAQNSFYIGDAIFVEGARPDIAIAYPDYPNNNKAGWGYMLLTNFLPNNGNGTFTLEAQATDTSGNLVVLGSKTIYCDNANAVNPFGAIDTPSQGGTASGNNYINNGWVLTPQPNHIPVDGKTIEVWVDSVKKGYPVYNLFRPDIASLLPGYANSNGAAGSFSFDTTGYTNGVHTIHWIATDSAGNSSGIGSRYFTIQNSSYDYCQTIETVSDPSPLKIPSLEPILVHRDGDQGKNSQWIAPAENGIFSIYIEELEPLEIRLGELFSGSHGYMKQGDILKPLPIGSTFDKVNAVFYWIPGPGFVGNYELVFIENHSFKAMRKVVEITILPHRS